MEGNVTVTLRRSPIGIKPMHRKTLRALGLRKRCDVRNHKITPVSLGMIKQVEFLLDVKQV